MPPKRKQAVKQTPIAKVKATKSTAPVIRDENLVNIIKCLVETMNCFPKAQPFRDPSYPPGLVQFDISDAAEEFVRSLVTRKDEDEAVNLYSQAVLEARLKYGDFDLGDVLVKNDGQAVAWLKKLKQIGCDKEDCGLDGCVENDQECRTMADYLENLKNEDSDEGGDSDEGDDSD